MEWKWEIPDFQLPDFQLPWSSKEMTEADGGEQSGINKKRLELQTKLQKTKALRAKNVIWLEQQTAELKKEQGVWSAAIQHTLDKLYEDKDYLQAIQLQYEADKIEGASPDLKWEVQIMKQLHQTSLYERILAPSISEQWNSSVMDMYNQKPRLKEELSERECNLLLVVSQVSATNQERKELYERQLQLTNKLLETYQTTAAAAAGVGTTTIKDTNVAADTEESNKSTTSTTSLNETEKVEPQKPQPPTSTTTRHFNVPKPMNADDLFEVDDDDSESGDKTPKHKTKPIMSRSSFSPQKAKDLLCPSIGEEGEQVDSKNNEDETKEKTSKTDAPSNRRALSPKRGEGRVLPNNSTVSNKSGSSVGTASFITSSGRAAARSRGLSPIRRADRTRPLSPKRTGNDDDAKRVSSSRTGKSATSSTRRALSPKRTGPTTTTITTGGDGDDTNSVSSSRTGRLATSSTRRASSPKRKGSTTPTTSTSNDDGTKSVSSSRTAKPSTTRRALSPKRTAGTTTTTTATTSTARSTLSPKSTNNAVRKTVGTTTASKTPTRRQLSPMNQRRTLSPKRDTTATKTEEQAAPSFTRD